MGLLDFGGNRHIQKMVKSGKLLCPFALGATAGGLGDLAAFKILALERGLTCGAWCKLYDNEKDDCRLVLT